MFDEALEEVEEETKGMCQFIYRHYAEFCHYHIFQKKLAISYYTKVQLNMNHPTLFMLTDNVKTRVLLFNRVCRSAPAPQRAGTA